MSLENLRDNKEGFVSTGSGDRLIGFETKLIGIIAFFVCLLHYDKGFFISLLVGGFIMFIIPNLIMFIEFLAWPFIILFSVLWAFFSYNIGAMIFGDSSIAKLVIGIIVFIISFFSHKVSLNLGYSSVESHVINSIDDIKENTKN